MSRATLIQLDSDSLCDSSSRLSPVAPCRQQTRSFTSIIKLWSERSKQRRQLLELADDPDLLKDLGLSNYDLKREGQKSFWRR